MFTIFFQIFRPLKSPFSFQLDFIAPVFVCESCETTLLNFHEFQREVLRSQELLLIGLQDEQDPFTEFIDDFSETDIFFPVDTPKFTCDICGQITMHKRTLKRHMLRHVLKNCVSPEVSIVKISPEKISDVFSRTCVLCKRVFKNERVLGHHMRYSHTEIGPLPCEFCGKCFKNMVSLRNHLKRLHGPEKEQFECDYCEKRFSRKSSLMEHHNTHTKRRPYKCLWCVKTFRNTSHFSVHRTTKHAKEYSKWKIEKYNKVQK